MTKRGKKPSKNTAADDALLDLGLRRGEQIRFKKSGDNSRWTMGKIHALEKDGSITIHDANGAARSLRPERIEIRQRSPRGQLKWCNLADALTSAREISLFPLADLE